MMGPSEIFFKKPRMVPEKYSSDIYEGFLRNILQIFTNSLSKKKKIVTVHQQYSLKIHEWFLKIILKSPSKILKKKSNNSL